MRVFKCGDCRRPSGQRYTYAGDPVIRYIRCEACGGQLDGSCSRPLGEPRDLSRFQAIEKARELWPGVGTAWRLRRAKAVGWRFGGVKQIKAIARTWRKALAIAERRLDRSSPPKT